MFSSMINILFANPLLSVAGTYTPLTGSPMSVRVVKTSPRQQEWSAYATHASVTPYLFDVRVSDVASPKDGDVLTIDGSNFTIRSAELDEAHLVWRLNVDKQ